MAKSEHRVPVNKRSSVMVHARLTDHYHENVFCTTPELLLGRSKTTGTLPESCKPELSTELNPLRSDRVLRGI